jgi:hypothetical protein
MDVVDDLKVKAVFEMRFPPESNKQNFKLSTLSTPVLLLFATTTRIFLYVAKATSRKHTSRFVEYDHPNNDGLQYPII